MRSSCYTRFATIAVVLILILGVAMQSFAAGDVLQRKGFKAGSSGVESAGPITCSNVATTAKVAIVNETTAARTVTSADFGKIIACSYAGATTITLPDPSASTVGATFYITELVDQSLTVVGGSTADNNKIIADGVLTSDSVAYSTASHKVGAMCRVIGISATKWLIVNSSSCAMTVEAAD